MQNDLERGVSWLTESRAMILPKHCPYFNERRAAKRRRAVRLSKCCSFGIYCLFGCFKSCLGHLSVASAGPSHLSSFPTFALLCCWTVSLHRHARFSEVSGLIIIREILLNQSAQLVPLISVNCVQKTLWKVFLTLQAYTTLFCFVSVSCFILLYI